MTDGLKNKLTLGEMVTAAAGLLLLIFGFFKWYGGGSVSLGDLGDIDLGGFSLNGWEAPNSFFSIIAILIGIAMAAQIIATKLANVKLPEKLGALGWGLLHLILGTVAFVFVLLKFIMDTSGTKFGIYGGLIASGGLMVGGYLIAKERGELPAALKNIGGGS